MENRFQNSIQIIRIFCYVFRINQRFLSFQNFINDILHEMFDEFCIAYIDDNLIFNNFKKKHQIHVRKIFAIFQKINLQTNIDKCEFHVIEINYLKLIVSTKKIRLSFKKIEIVQK